MVGVRAVAVGGRGRPSVDLLCLTLNNPTLERPPSRNAASESRPRRGRRSLPSPSVMQFAPSGATNERGRPKRYSPAGWRAT